MDWLKLFRLLYIADEQISIDLLMTDEDVGPLSWTVHEENSEFFLGLPEVSGYNYSFQVKMADVYHCTLVMLVYRVPNAVLGNNTICINQNNVSMRIRIKANDDILFQD